MSESLIENNCIERINVIDNISLITVNNLENNDKLIAGIFTALGNAEINVDMITKTYTFKNVVNISFSLFDDDMTRAVAVVKKFINANTDTNILVNNSNTKITVFGDGMKAVPGIAALVFSILAQNDIEIKMITTSEVDISVLIESIDEDKASNILKEQFAL